MLSVASVLGVGLLVIPTPWIAQAASNGSVTLAKQAVIDGGSSQPTISNVPGVDGQTFSYQLAYTCVVNSGYTCKDVVVADDIPAELEIVGTYPAEWVISGNHVQIPIGDVGPGAGTREVAVRFRTSASYVANQTVTTVNQANVAYAIGNSAGTVTEQGSGASNSVSVTGVVAPLGGVTATKSLSPAVAQEFAGSTTVVTLGAKNAGTDSATVVISDETAAFFDAFDLASTPTATSPATATATTVEVKVAGVWGPIPSSLPADIDGVRVTFAGVAGGQSGSLSFTAKLRDSRGDGSEIVAGGSLVIANTLDAATHYSDPSIDKTAQSTANITVTGATSGTPRLTKSVSPVSVLVGSVDPITYTLTNSWSPATGASGGVGRLVFTDPVAGGNNPFTSDVDVDSISVNWPTADPAFVTLETNCGTTGPVARTGDNQQIALPCGGEQITSLKVTIAPANGVYPSGASATVKIASHLQAGAATTAHVVKNDAQVDTTSAFGALASTATAVDASFSVVQPTFQSTTAKRFAKPQSTSSNNTVILTSDAVATPSNAAVDKLVVQDPPDPTAAANFYNQYDLTAIRPLDCPSGYAAAVEIWDSQAGAWVTPAAMTGDGCSYAGGADLSAAEQAVATGVRITYTRAVGGVSTVTVQPKLAVALRSTDRATGTAIVVPAYDPAATDQGSWLSTPNCASSALYVGATAIASSVLSGSQCPVLKQSPSTPATGGFGLAKVLGTVRGGAIEPTLQELSGGTFYARLQATQTGAMSNVQSVTLSDPVDIGTTSTGSLAGGYQASTASQVFASATNIQQVISNAVPAHERAQLEMWDVTTQSWVAVQTVNGNGSNVINYTPSTASYATYGGWRLVVSENPADPGDTLGFLESTTYNGSALVADVKYQLRQTFRTSVGVHTANDPVLNNLCYGVSDSVLQENTDGSVADACNYSFAPYNGTSAEYLNDAGRLINDATVAAVGTYGDDPTLVTSSIVCLSDEGSLSQRDLLIVSSSFNAEIVKSFWKGSVQDGSGTAVPATVPIPPLGQAPGTLQERTLRLSLYNQTPFAMTLTARDTAPEFWNMFELVAVQTATLAPASPAYSTASQVTYTLAYSNGTTFTGTIGQINALTNLADVTGVTAVANATPAGTPGMPQAVEINLLVRLRPTVTTTDGAVNEASLDADAWGAPFATEHDQAAIKAVPSQHSVAAAKTIALAPGQVNAVDLKPLLTVGVAAENTGDLSVSALTVEDDDDLSSGYATPSVPATLPTNSGTDFWPNVTFQHVTGITLPSQTDSVTVEAFVAGGWVTVGTYGQGVTAAAVDQAIGVIASPAAVKGLRVVFGTGSGYAVGASGGLTYQVAVNTDAPTSAMTNCSEAGMQYLGDRGIVAEYQNPACASFTPQLGTLKVDVDKTTSVSTALSGDVVPWTFTVLNNGQQAIGLHAGAAPLTIVDWLPASLVWDPTIASVGSSFPSPQVTSTFAGTLPAATYDAATNSVTWQFPTGQALGAGEKLTLTFNLRVAAAVAAGNAVVNRAGVVMPDASACTTGDTYISGACTDTAQVNVSSGANLRPLKTIDAGPSAKAISVDPAVTCTDGGPQTYPCVALTPAGSTYTWKLSLQNSGNVNLNGAVLIDRLPALADTSIQGGFARGTEWISASRGPVSVSSPGLNAGSVAVQYLPSGATQSCFDEISTGVTCTDWVTLAAGAPLPATAIGLRVAVPYSSANGLFQPGTSITASWSEVVPESLVGTADTHDPSGAAVPDGALQQWNNFSARVAAATSLQVTSYKAGAQFDSAMLDIRKIVDEATVVDPASFGAFSIDVTCRFRGHVIYTGAVSVADGETQRIAGLPSGTTCTLTEQNAPTDFVWSGDEDTSTPEGDYTVAYDPKRPAAVTAVLTNRYAGEVVAVDKVVRGSTSDVTFAVAASCTYKGAPITLTPGQDVFSISATSSGSIGSLPPGAICTVTESDNGAASYSDATVAIRGVTVGSAHGTDSVSITFTVDENSPTVVTFTNSYVVDLTITKRILGAQAGTTTPKFTVACSFEGGDISMAPGDAMFSLGDGETKSISGLLDGSSCDVVESDAAGAIQTTVSVLGGAPHTFATASGSVPTASVSMRGSREVLFENDYSEIDSISVVTGIPGSGTPNPWLVTAGLLLVLAGVGWWRIGFVRAARRMDGEGVSLP